MQIPHTYSAVERVFAAHVLEIISSEAAKTTPYLRDGSVDVEAFMRETWVGVISKLSGIAKIDIGDSLLPNTLVKAAERRARNGGVA